MAVKRVSVNIAGLTVIVILALAGAFIAGRLSGSGGSVHQHAGSEKGTGKDAVWTCSMHPQIKLPGPGQCPICFMDLIPLEGDGSGAGERDLKVTEEARKLAEIVTVPVTRQPVFNEVRMVGFVEYDETRVRAITARFPGRLEKMHVDFTGVRVKSGEPLFTIYSPELYAAQEEYLQALRGTNDALREAAREKLSLWDLTPGQIASIEEKGSAETRMTVHSPSSGVVINKHGSEGMYVSTGMPVYTIADLGVVWVKMDAYETDLPWIRVGQQVSFTTRAAPGRSLKGRVSFIDPVLDMKTRTVKVRVTVANGNGLLKPGMFVSGSLEAAVGTRGGLVTGGRARTNPLVIPFSAPLITGKRAVVYVRKTGSGGPVYEGRDVVLGPRAGEYYVVLDGVKEGELVVAQGAFKIDAALQMEGRTSMMVPADGGTDTRSLRVPAGFTKSLKPLYAAYFQAQEGLAADEQDRALQGLKGVREALREVKTSLAKGAAADAWNKLESDLKNELTHVDHMKELSALRTMFRGVSNLVIELEKNFGHAGKDTHHVAFCPMAFDNVGGSWLQRDETVSNPYYGAAMLRCGEIKQTMEGK